MKKFPLSLILILLILKNVKNQEEKSEKQIKMDACIKIVQAKLSKEMEYFREITKLMKNSEMKEEESFNHLFTLVLLSCYSQIAYFDAEEIDSSLIKINFENEQISKLVNLEKWENLFRENNQENLHMEMAQLNEAYSDIQKKEVNLDLLKKNRINNNYDNSNNEKDERMDNIYMRNREDNLDFNIFGFNFTQLSDKYRYIIGGCLISFVFLSVIYGLKWINDIRNEGKKLKKKKKNK